MLPKFPINAAKATRPIRVVQARSTSSARSTLKHDYDIRDRHLIANTLENFLRVIGRQPEQEAP